MPPLSFNKIALARLFEARQGLNDLLNERDNLNLYITKLEAQVEMLINDSRIMQDHIRCLTKTLQFQPSATCAATISRWVQKTDASRHQIGKIEAELAEVEDQMAGYLESITTLRERGE